MRKPDIETLIRDLWRNYPTFDSTFSPCPNKECSGYARGTLDCANCIEEQIGELVGFEEALNLHVAIQRVREAEMQVRDRAAQ